MNRREVGVALVQAGWEVGRPQSYIADIERNERRIDVIEFLALAEVIGFDPLGVLEEVRAVPAE
ncbi:transcriptional regulator [Xanthobacter autotrophicus]|uniref:transcriptional regulator n=1 Tax=Xanthobacter autotrophicus TaxID=280 RepID=UPI00372AB1DA